MAPKFVHSIYVQIRLGGREDGNSMGKSELHSRHKIENQMFCLLKTESLWSSDKILRGWGECRPGKGQTLGPCMWREQPFLISPVSYLVFFYNLVNQCISQLSIDMTKSWENRFTKRISLFWLIVLEILMLWADGGTSWQECVLEQNCSPYSW